MKLFLVARGERLRDKQKIKMKMGDIGRYLFNSTAEIR